MWQSVQPTPTAAIVAVAPFHVGGKHRRVSPAIHGFAENQVAFGEIQADVLLNQIDFPNPVALLRIQARIADSGSQIGGDGVGGSQRRRYQRQDAENPSHTFSLLPSEPGGGLR
jgi:hypothetical protein